MRIRIVKRADGAGVLRCIRDDGSETWQKQTDRHAAFFALHDLTHYTVETELGYRRGFFGLVAEGWDIEDTGGKGAKGRLPAEAGEVEQIVGLLDSERVGGVVWSVAEFNEAVALIADSHGVVAPKLTGEQIRRIRKRRSELFAAWGEVAPGGSLELEFEPAPAAR